MRNIPIHQTDLKAFLEEKYHQYNCRRFIATDPIQIPKAFEEPGDIEIAGFFTATIAWGQRKTIINNMYELLRRMDYRPFDFIMNAGKADLENFSNFKHRTFNGEDCIFFIQSIKNIYQNHGGIRHIFEKAYRQEGSIEAALTSFRNVFFEIPFPERTQKHVADISKNASAKRLNMFLRWMVRDDKEGIDFGIWKGIAPKDLYIPLDVHSGNVARKLGLLTRKQNDWKAVLELTGNLRQFDPQDPVKYDFALFGLGAFERF
ncbi:MAG: TIGR02757 family protein [Bacteroidales bacterium]|nr:TIGR02757 family protein [Bacteroidales bacterium]